MILLHCPRPDEFPQLDTFWIIHQDFIVAMNVCVEIDPRLRQSGTVRAIQSGGQYMTVDEMRPRSFQMEIGRPPYKFTCRRGPRHQGSVERGCKCKRAPSSFPMYLDRSSSDKPRLSLKYCNHRPPRNDMSTLLIYRLVIWPVDVSTFPTQARGSSTQSC